MDEIKSIEEKLIAIWEDILDLPSVSPDDDYFLVGGNSLTAIELLIRIQREFRVNFPPDTIYRNPTIRRQTTLIAGKIATMPRYHPLIVPISRNGSLPPLFCIHPLGGWMNHYSLLSQYININRPIFGIRAQGLEPTELIPRTVEETVLDQIDAIKSVQEEGPYHLMGFSYGGILAYELACQLHERGDQISYLGIIDVSAPAPEVRYFKALTKTLFPGKVFGKIPSFIESSLKANPDSIIFVIISKSVRFVFHRILFRSGSKSLPASITDAYCNVNLNKNTLARYPKESQPHMKRQLIASLTYLPQKYSGDITFFSTGPDQILFPGDITRGWGSYVNGKTVVIEVPGNHSTLFDEPNLGVLAEKIEATLVSPDDQK